jgi:pilus assembly protein CpaB
MILVAVTDLKPGDKIDNVEQKFEQKRYLKNTAPFGSFTPDDVKAKPEKIIGKTLVKPLAKGEAITEKHLTDENITNDLAPGYRAMSIPVRIDNITSGFALPGSNVDLLTKYNTPDGKTVSKIFLQDIRVLAVGTETKKPEGAQTMGAAQVVTLAVTPKDAAKINWAMSIGGQITMALRKPGDDKKEKEVAVSGLGGNDVGDGDDKTTETVLVAMVDIDKGTDLKGKDLKEFFKEQRVPSDLFGSDTYVKSIGEDILKDAKVKEPIKKNTYVMRGQLGDLTGKADAPPPGPAPTLRSHFVTIFNGNQAPVRVQFVQDGGGWAASGGVGGDNSSPPPAPAPAPAPADKDGPKTGSEGK